MSGFTNTKNWYPGAALYTAGKFYGGAPGTGNSTRALVNATNWYVPLQLFAQATFDQFACEVTAAGTGVVLRFALYADTGTLQPGTLLVDSGALNVGSGTAVQSIAITPALSLPAGLYWIAFNQPASTLACTVRASSDQRIDPRIGGLAATDVTQGNCGCLKTANGSGDAGAYQNPATVTGLSPVSTFPVVALRAA